LEAKDLKKVLALGMLGLLLAFAVALGTSATFRDYHAERSVHVDVVADDDELIDLTPVQPYAYINKTTGKLVIDFSANNENYPFKEPTKGLGISPKSRYNFDEVFNVSNHLWENKYIVVEVISSNNNIKFYNPTKDDDGIWRIYETGENGSAAYSSDTAKIDVCFYLAPGEALGVGMELEGPNDARDGDLYGNITIKAWPADDAPIICKAGGGPQ